MANALDRLQAQRAQRLLELLQSDIRAQIRTEEEALGRHNGGRARETECQKIKRRLVRLADPTEREMHWTRIRQPTFQGQLVAALPKTRSFWERVDVTLWTKRQLDVACALLDLPTGGKKMELIAQIQDWVHEPTIQAYREEQERLARQNEATLASGRVFAFGSNFNGELGLGHRTSCREATEIESLRGIRVKQVFSGFDANFAFALAGNGRVFAWGGGGVALADQLTDAPEELPASHAMQDKNRQQSARPATANEAPPMRCFLLPRELPQLSAKRIVQLACGRSKGHIACLTSDGRCFAWGKGENGELGLELQRSKVPGPLASSATGLPSACNGPRLVESLSSSSIAQVSVGNSHTIALTDKGQVYAWGNCWNGQLGVGESKRAGVSDKRMQSCFPVPTIVEALWPATKISRVACGAVHTAVISVDGHLYTFGCSDGGRLGLGHNNDALHPEQVKALEREFVLDICCGSWHSLCIARPRDQPQSDSKTDGFLYSFGSGLQGQLGLGKQKLAALPTRIPGLYNRRTRCQAIATSSHHSCALSSAGSLFTWGQNTNGCLGRPTVDGAIDSAEPDVIQRPSSSGREYAVGPIISIAAGHAFTIFATGPCEQEQTKDHFQHQEKLNRHTKFTFLTPISKEPKQHKALT